MYDLIIVGGGPAGTAAAIAAARHNATVLVLEQSRFPRHKVCGEFVSAESLALLRSLLQPDTGLLDQAPRVSSARLFLDRRCLPAAIDPAAASISRFDLDLALWRAAQAAGASARLQTPVRKISGSGPFRVETADAAWEARALIDASGRWSSLSPRLPLAARRKWLGIKAHFREPNPPPSVDLYFFKGGYCGVQPLGNGLINVSALLRAEGVSTLSAAFAQHPDLRLRSHNWQPATGPVATSPLFFRPPQALRGAILLAGDAAGFIDPFVGDGIALALRSGSLACQSLLPFWRGEISLSVACEAYKAAYESSFHPIFRNARRLRELLALPALIRAPFVGLLSHTGLPTFVVRSTRGRVP